MVGDIIGAVFLFLFFVLAAGFLTLVFVAPLVATVYTIMDIVHRDDLSAGKPLWVLAVIFLPLMGMVVYWLSRPTGEPPAVVRAPAPAASQPANMPRAA